MTEPKGQTKTLGINGAGTARSVHTGHADGQSVAGRGRGSGGRAVGEDPERNAEFAERAAATVAEIEAEAPPRRNACRRCSGNRAMRLPAAQGSAAPSRRHHSSPSGCTAG